MSSSPQPTRCRRVGSVRWCRYCLDVSHSTLHRSTFVCPSVVDAPPCSPTVLSRGWWSVDVDAGVSVQRAATASSVESVSWYCRCLDVSCSSLPRSTSLCPSVVDGRSSVPSASTPTTHVRCLSTSCRRSCTSTLTIMQRRRCLKRSRSMWIVRAVVDGVPPAVDGPSRRLHPRCGSLPRQRSM